MAATGAACVAYGTFIERRWFRAREVRVPGVLAPGSPPFTILHVSDIHLDPPDPRTVGFVRGLAGRPADLVVATGDLLGEFDAEDAAVELLGALTAGGTPGLAVLGSHDVYGPTRVNPFAYFRERGPETDGPRLQTKRLVAGLEDAGWRVLTNERAVVDTARGPIAVAGLEDPHLRKRRLPPADEVACPDGEWTLRLGLVHAPYLRAVGMLADAGYDLVLSGHTHGGQVRLPGIGALVGNCDLPLDQIRGLSRVGHAWLHVSPGLGTSKYAPFRFACRPEATFLVLT